MAPDEDRPPRSLAEHFQSHDPSRQGGAWDALWGEGFTPWDRGGPSWALYDLLTERPDLFEPLSNEDTSAGAVCGTSTGKERGKKTALVPGCGRGHDVLLLSSLGYDMVGLEVSEHALEEARKNATAAAAAAAAAVRAGAGEGENGVSRGRIRWISGDFFQDDWLREAADIVGSGGVGGGGGGGGGKFDLIFDYTVRERPITLLLCFSLSPPPTCLYLIPICYSREEQKYLAPVLTYGWLGEGDQPFAPTHTVSLRAASHDEAAVGRAHEGPARPGRQVGVSRVPVAGPRGAGAGAALGAAAARVRGVPVAAGVPGPGPRLERRGRPW